MLKLIGLIAFIAITVNACSDKPSTNKLTVDHSAIKPFQPDNTKWKRGTHTDHMTGSVSSYYTLAGDGYNSYLYANSVGNYVSVSIHNTTNCWPKCNVRVKVDGVMKTIKFTGELLSASMTVEDAWDAQWIASAKKSIWIDVPYYATAGGRTHALNNVWKFDI